MSVAQQPSRSECRHCGSPYRPSPWGRRCLCPACGLPLDGGKPAGREAPVALRLPSRRVLLAAVGAASLGGALYFGWGWLSSRRPDAAAPASVVAVPLTPPPGTEARFAEKLRYLEEDLAVQPRQPH